MDNTRMKEILEKQLELLSEYSRNGDASLLPEITDSMVRVVTLLREL